MREAGPQKVKEVTITFEDGEVVDFQVKLNDSINVVLIETTDQGRPPKDVRYFLATLMQKESD